MLSKAQSILKIFVFKKAEIKGIPRILQTAKDEFLIPRRKPKRMTIFCVSYLLAPRVHYASTER